MEIQDRIRFVHGIMGCFHEIAHWVYDPEMRLLHCSSPDAALLDRHFISREQTGEILAHARSGSLTFIYTSLLYTAWLAAVEREAEQVRQIHLFGPFFPDNASVKECEAQLHLSELPPADREVVWQLHQAIPVVFSNYFIMYLVMLRYCLTDSACDISELSLHRFPVSHQPGRENQELQEGLRQQHEIEQQMVRMIGEGNLDYRKLIGKAMMVAKSPAFYQRETLRQTKNRTYARAGLVAEAAIQGGIDVEVALPMLYHHLQSMEDANTIGELGQACSNMEEDFARQVYRRRTASMSKTVLDCCDYIQYHLEDEDLSRSKLARMLNYSEGYLSRKFSQEMGQTIKDYISQQRLERSRSLLKNTKLSVQDISAQLCFGSHSHFAAAFKKAYGITPRQYREQQN